MPRTKSTAANTRKRGAEEASNSESPTKKAKTAKDQSIENIQKDIIRVDEGEANELMAKAENISEEKLINGTQPKSAKARGKKGAVAKSIKTEAVQEEAEDPIIPKKAAKRIKVEASEREEEEKSDPSKGTPGKAKRNKVELEEKEQNGAAADGEGTPKKIKRKRKTQEEKEAEAMPLAARTTGLRMFVGAHVSSAKGVQNAVTNCVHIGGNAFALFLKSQRKWDNPPLQDEHRDAFKSNCVLHKYDAASHVLPHGSYLVNLAQSEKDKAKQAYDTFLEDLHRCEALGIKYYNFHPGTTNNHPRPEALARIASALNRAHAATKTVIPLLENMASGGNVIGSTFEDLRDIIALVEDKSRIGVCLDTCHAHASGYDLRTPTAFATTLSHFSTTVGLPYLRALHLNDSKAPFASKRDLHQNIGLGFLGLRAFHNVMNEKRFEGLPMVLETPIDRKVDEGEEEEADGGSASEDKEEEQSKKMKKGKGKAKGTAPAGRTKEKTIEDKGIWAREIKLLESLIGMDADGAEFKELEATLAARGVEERKKYQDAFDRKVAKEKAKTKDIRTFFGKETARTKGNGKAKAKADKDDGSGSESPLSELADVE